MLSEIGRRTSDSKASMRISQCYRESKFVSLIVPFNVELCASEEGGCRIKITKKTAKGFRRDDMFVSRSVTT